MGKVKTGSYNPLPIVPIVLVGANVNGKPNYMPIGFVGGADNKPPIIMISSTPHYTIKGIIENGTFSINIPSSDQVIETDYCGLASGKTTDKSEIFTTFYGELESAPMIEECSMTGECKLMDKKEFPEEITYFGEVHQVYVNEEVFENNKFDITKVNPMVLSHGEYRIIGEGVGQSYKIGRNYIRTKIIRGPKSFIGGPQYIEKEEFQVIGIEEIGKNKYRNHQQLWKKFFEIIIKFYENITYAYEIHMTTNELSEKGEYRNIVGREIDKINIPGDIPEGVVLVTISAQKYAIFTHIGSDVNLMETVKYIYEEWLPNNKKYERVPLAPEFVRFDDRFEKDSDNSELDYYIPIQEKSS